MFKLFLYLAPDHMKVCGHFLSNITHKQKFFATKTQISLLCFCPFENVRMCVHSKNVRICVPLVKMSGFVSLSKNVQIFVLRYLN